MLWGNRVPLNVKGGGDYINGANRAGKFARSLFNCIFIPNDIQINENNKLIGIGHLYVRTWSVHPKFDAFSIIVRGEMGNSNPLG